jgi:general secretion pathway protein L
MADTIVIYLEDLANDRISWQPIGKKPSPLSPRGTGTLAQAAEKIRGWRLVLAAPSSAILLTKVAIPSKNKQRLIQAIPFALENDLTEEIDQLHFAPSLQSDQGSTLVAVVSRKRLEEWLERFNNHELRPLALYPELLCLPLTNGHWSVYLENEKALVRTGKNSGFVADRENLLLLLKAAEAEAAAPPEQLDLIIDPALDKETAIAPIKQLEYSYSELAYNGDLTHLLAENLDEKQSLNILQGDYKQVDTKALQWRRWLPAAALFASLISLQAIGTILDYSHYKQQSVDLASEIEQVFRGAFPDTKRIVDPRVQMEQQLKLLRKNQGGEQVNFLAMLDSPAAAIMKMPGNRVESINFRDNQLDLKLTLKELQTLENLKKKIEAGGLSVEIRSANAAGNQVTAHLRIRRGGI